MKTCFRINEFCKEVIRYVGSGYSCIKFVEVPQNKEHKLNGIKAKIETTYETNLTRGKRQWNRIKGRANFAAVSYKNIICIFKTPGSENLTKKDFINALGLEMKFSSFLTLVLIKDERNKLTFKLGRDTFRWFKGEYQLSFKNGNGKNFHTLQKMWKGLPAFKGIGQQRKLLNIYLKELSKTYKKKWDIKF